MALDTTAMTDLYVTLYTTTASRYDMMWSENQIDAETYAKLLSELSASLIQAVPGIVQNQQQIDSQIAIAEAQSAQDLINKQKQVEAIEIENVVKEGQYQDSLLTSAKQRASIDKEIEAKAKQIESMQIEDAIKSVQSEKDLEVKTQQIASMLKEDDVKVAQKAMIDQQKLTEIQNTAKVTNDIQYVIKQIEAVDVDMQVKEVQSSKDLEVKDNDINVKTRQIVVTETQSEQDLINKQKQVESLEIENMIKTAQSDKDIEVKTKQVLDIANQIGIRSEQSVADLQVKQAQVDSTVSDMGIKKEQSTKDLLVKQAQIDNVASEVAVRNAQSSKDLLVKDKNMAMIDSEIAVKGSQKQMIDQQKLTEVQNTTLVINQGNDILKATDVKNKQIESMDIDNMIKAAQSDKDLLVKAEDINLKIAQEGIINQQKLTEVQKTETEKAQTNMLQIQGMMVSEQSAQIAPNAEKQRAVQDAQIAQVQRETNYTLAKTDVMVKSRLDNLVIETSKMMQQKVMGLGNGQLVPSPNDFANEQILLQALYNRAKEESMPEATIATATAYKKATT